MLKAARRLELHSKERADQSVQQKKIGEIIFPLNLLLQLYIVLLPPEFYFMLTQLSASCPSCKKKKNLKATD